MKIGFGTFDKLPTDIKIFLLESLDLEDFHKVCDLNESFRNFCEQHSNILWRKRIRKDFNLEYKGPEDSKLIYKDILDAENFYNLYGRLSIKMFIKLKDGSNFFGVLYMIKEKGLNSEDGFELSVQRGYYEMVKFLLENVEYEQEFLNYVLKDVLKDESDNNITDLLISYVKE